MDLFRKSSLEKLASPEQLDKAITIARPASWLALIGVTLIFIITAIWAFNGTLPVTIHAPGIVVVVPATAAEDAQHKWAVECYIPFVHADKIKTGMRAVVRASNKNLRFNAEVIGIAFDETDFSNIELAIGGNEIMVAVILKPDNLSLTDRSLVSADIIIEEFAPINLLFRNFNFN